MDGTEFNIVQTILDAGALGVMAIWVWAFLTGKIMSKKTHDEIVEKLCENNEKTMEIFANKISQELEKLPEKIKESVSKGVEDGYVKGFIRTNGGKDADT